MTVRMKQYRGFIAPLFCPRFIDANHVRLRGHRIVLNRYRQNIRLACANRILWLHRLEIPMCGRWLCARKFSVLNFHTHTTSRLKKSIFGAHLRNFCIKHKNSRCFQKWHFFKTANGLGILSPIGENPCAPSLRSAHQLPVRSLLFRLYASIEEYPTYPIRLRSYQLVGLYLIVLAVG